MSLQYHSILKGSGSYRGVKMVQYASGICGMRANFMEAQATNIKQDDNAELHISTEHTRMERLVCVYVDLVQK